MDGGTLGVATVRVVRLGPDAIGERLAVDLCDAAGRLMLSAGTELTERLVLRLSTRGYLSLGVIDPLAPDVVALQAIGEETRREVMAALADCLRSAGETGRVVLGRDLWGVLEDIREGIQQSGAVAVHLSGLRSLGEYTLAHSANVCVYTMILGAVIGLDSVDLRYLGLGALLHDIGKIHYMTLVEKSGPLTDEEFALMQRHTTDGFELLRRQQDIDLRCAHMAFQHHERLDGSGYPRGLAGAAIHPFAQAVAIADVYDTMTADRAYGCAQPPHVALGELQSMADAGLLDRHLVRQFVGRLAAYPEGTVVQLGTGELAVVVAQTNRGPRAPRVRVVADAALHLLGGADERDVAPGLPGSEIAAVLNDYPPHVREQVLAV